MPATYGWGYTKRYFDRLMWLSYSGWAWEFKRRDPELLRAYRMLKTRPVSIMRSDGSQLFRLRLPCEQSEQFGLQFLPDPRLSAYETPIFWLPHIMTSNLDAAGELGLRFAQSDEQLSLPGLPGKKSILISPGRRTKLAIAARGYAAQIAINAPSAPLPLGIYLTLKVGAGARMLQKVECFDQFARFCSGLHFDAKPRRGYAPIKLRQALTALDGWLSGASQREIAGVIFGAKLVSEDWNDGVHSYKSRTRRLIKKGRSLMEKDYLKLL